MVEWSQNVLEVSKHEGCRRAWHKGSSFTFAGRFHFFHGDVELMTIGLREGYINQTWIIRLPAAVCKVRVELLTIDDQMICLRVLRSIM